MAVDVAHGTPFLGRATKQGHVILWKTEDSFEDIADDLRKVGMTERSDLSILIPDLSNGEYGEDSVQELNTCQLQAELKQYPNTRLVIIETLDDFLNVDDITNNDEVRRALQKFNECFVARYPDTSFLLLHHFTKSDDYGSLASGKGLIGKKVLGATALKGKIDALICMEQVSDADPRRIILVDIRKGERIPPTYLDFDEQTQRSILGGNVADALIQDRKRQRDQKTESFKNDILQIVIDNPGLAKWTVVHEAGGTRAVTGAIVDELIKANHILIKDAGGKSHAQLLYPYDYDFSAERASENAIEDNSNLDCVNVDYLFEGDADSNAYDRELKAQGGILVP
jgi:hypothetical protein